MVGIAWIYPVVVLRCVTDRVRFALLAMLCFVPCLYRVVDPVYFFVCGEGLVSLALSSFLKKVHVLGVLLKFDTDIVLGAGEGDLQFVKLSTKFVNLVVKIS
jgi:hypothetical protein